MKKVVLSIIMAMVGSVGIQASSPDIDIDINDWGYVEDGMIYVKVYTENAQGIRLTTDSEATIEVGDGLNTVKVPVNEHSFTVEALSGYTISSIKVGNTNLEVTASPMVIDCSFPAPIYIVAQDISSVNNECFDDFSAAPRYFDLNGYEQTTPKEGHLYICVQGRSVTKILWNN